jgi:hypothetical protein
VTETIKAVVDFGPPKAALGQYDYLKVQPKPAVPPKLPGCPREGEVDASCPYT